MEHLESATGPGPRRVGLVGVSPMTRRCGLRLRDRGVAVTVINRSADNAQELAEELGADCGTRILALPMTVSFEVLLADGISRLRGRPGDWLVDYGDGSLGVVSQAIFAQTYEILD